MGVVYIVGDIHGHFDHLIRLLRDEVSLIDENFSWVGADATLCFLGDYFDRGPDGVSTIELIMRLQSEAPESGGQVIALLGNHEPFLLSAYHFGKRSPISARYVGTAVDDWRAVGGIDTDLERLTWQQSQWLTNLPAMVKIHDRLCIHADALFYVSYGRSVEEVNEAISSILRGRDRFAWDTLIGRFIFRRAFQGERGTEAAQEFLNIFGGAQIIHGHTPIRYITGQPSSTVIEPMIYANNLCVNIDHGLYLGGMGFVYKLPDE